MFSPLLGGDAQKFERGESMARCTSALSACNAQTACSLLGCLSHTAAVGPSLCNVVFVFSVASLYIRGRQQYVLQSGCVCVGLRIAHLQHGNYLQRLQSCRPFFSTLSNEAGGRQCGIAGILMDNGKISADRKADKRSAVRSRMCTSVPENRWGCDYLNLGQEPVQFSMSAERDCCT